MKQLNTKSKQEQITLQIKFMFSMFVLYIYKDSHAVQDNIVILPSSTWLEQLKTTKKCYSKTLWQNFS